MDCKNQLWIEYPIMSFDWGQIGFDRVYIRTYWVCPIINPTIKRTFLISGSHAKLNDRNLATKMGIQWGFNGDWLQRNATSWNTSLVGGFSTLENMSSSGGIILFLMDFSEWLSKHQIKLASSMASMAQGDHHQPSTHRCYRHSSWIMPGQKKHPSFKPDQEPGSDRQQ